MTDFHLPYAENWIWLPTEQYPHHQTTLYCNETLQIPDNYTVVEIRKQFAFEKTVVSARLRFCADTCFQLYCNQTCIAAGPVVAGRDFIGNQIVRDPYYACTAEIFPQSRMLDFQAVVQMAPYQLCDYSKGHGGFMLFGQLTFEDGTQDVILTDESWLIRKNNAYCAPCRYDERLKSPAFVHAERTANIWNTQTSPLPLRTEKELFPDGGTIHLAPHEEKTAVVSLDKIYAGFLHLQAVTSGVLFADLCCRELDEFEESEKESAVFTHTGSYRGFRLHSAGNIYVKLKNDSDQPSQIVLSLVTTHYPVTEEAATVTDDPELNLVLDVCKHTLKYCRQTHHLDSPRHCEPLACTGDYYIESLMTLFSFGDMRLAEFDLLRTAQILLHQDGRMFHTTYSLIWVKMLYDVYMITGHRALLEQCLAALQVLLNRFETYVGANGLIETPPDYMFIDWLYLDGFSLHHPPKALGQSCLNMFYFGALDSAVQIFETLELPAMAEKYRIQKENIRQAVNTQLFDAERGMYFEGLNTPTEPHLISGNMPLNPEKRYYRKHANILAAYFGICSDEQARLLIHKIMAEEIEGEYQPYFAHYLLEAIYRCDLRDSYTRTVLERWKAPVLACSKGLVEGFVPPEPTYKFDHSHAWGGTPLYSLPKALIGLKILRPGMQTIQLSPSLLGMKHATVSLLTPYGKVTCQMNENEEPKITHPTEITVLLR